MVPRRFGRTLVRIERVTQRVSSAPEVPEKTVNRLLRERKETREALPRRRQVKMDSFELAALRQLVHTMYANKEFVSQN